MKSSFRFGNSLIQPNLFLSPMHGVTDRSFRRLTQALAEGETSLHVSEFVAVEALASGAKKEFNMLKPHASETQFCAQIFGVDINAMEAAAIHALEHGAHFLELNCGCPAPKVVKRGGGSGLLRDLPHLTQIIKKLRATVDVPLSIKVRTGWSDEEINLRESHRIAEGEGADLFVVHGRTRLQGYRGLADWDRIADVKSVSKIPIIGNGDIISLDDVLEKLSKYEVDGVSLGRGAMHNPWIFKQYAEYLKGGTWKGPNASEVIDAFRLFYQFMKEDGFEEKRYMGRLKQLSARIFKCVPNASEYRGKLLRTHSWEEFETQISLWEANIERSLREQNILDFSELGNLNGKPDREIQSGVDYKK